MRLFKLLSFSLIAGCANYRAAGPYRTSAEYTTGSENVEATRYQPSASFRLGWPVERIKINRGFRPRSDRGHQGIDLGGSLDTPILAAHEGRVVYAGHQFSGYGNMVLLEFDGRWATLYGHLNRIKVAERTVVRAGDLLGYMGRTGHATGVHLHFEVLASRQPVDPQAYLPTSLRSLAGQ